MNYVKLTDAEANHLLTLIDNNEQEGVYWGNREQWTKRSEKLKELLSDSMLTLDERYERDNIA